jgi:hypothetical protein
VRSTARWHGTHESAPPRPAHHTWIRGDPRALRLHPDDRAHGAASDAFSRHLRGRLSPTWSPGAETLDHPICYAGSAGHAEAVALYDLAIALTDNAAEHNFLTARRAAVEHCAVIDSQAGPR